MGIRNRDPVRAWLRSHGAPDFVVDGGLEYLASRWEEIAGAVATGYTLGLDDYLNDLDVREMLDGALGVARARERLAFTGRVRTADERFREATREADKCLWGDAVEGDEAWSAETAWWYYRVPLVPGDELEGDLRRRQ